MNSVMTTHHCLPWAGPPKTWVPSKSALERESWSWNGGDRKSGKFIRTKEKMGGDGECWRLTESEGGEGERK